MEWAMVLGLFVSLLAILDPVGCVPAYIALTGDVPRRARRWIAFLLAGFIALALVAALWAGHWAMLMFGVSIPALRIAGGVLLLTIGLQMAMGRNHDERANRAALAQGSDFGIAEARFKDVLVPLGVPLFVGPGSLATVMVFADQAHGSGSPWMQLSALSVTVVACALVVLVVLLPADRIARLLGTQGLAVVTRVMGLILTAMAVQVVMQGLAQAMPSLFDAEALKPG